MVCMKGEWEEVLFQPPLLQNCKYAIVIFLTQVKKDFILRRNLNLEEK